MQTWTLTAPAGRRTYPLTFREGLTTRLSDEKITTRCGWRPFLGREVAVLPDLVVGQGHVAAESAVIWDDLPAGQVVRYGRPTS